MAYPRKKPISEDEEAFEEACRKIRLSRAQVDNPAHIRAHNRRKLEREKTLMSKIDNSIDSR